MTATRGVPPRVATGAALDDRASQGWTLRRLEFQVGPSDAAPLDPARDGGRLRGGLAGAATCGHASRVVADSAQVTATRGVAPRVATGAALDDPRLAGLDPMPPLGTTAAPRLDPRDGRPPPRGTAAAFGAGWRELQFVATRHALSRIRLK